MVTILANHQWIDHSLSTTLACLARPLHTGAYRLEIINTALIIYAAYNRAASLVALLFLSCNTVFYVVIAVLTSAHGSF